jgi:hypothetical protein
MSKLHGAIEILTLEVGQVEPRIHRTIGRQRGDALLDRALDPLGLLVVKAVAGLVATGIILIHLDEMSPIPVAGRVSRKTDLCGKE